MLAIPGRETKLENVNAKVDLDREHNLLARNNGTAMWDGLLVSAAGMGRLQSWSSPNHIRDQAMMRTKNTTFLLRN
ncbi:Hypothetical predicted protein [Olea europaea subsp. europaea]|uniref:Uncharacterized protein n=1 Tax=Olea europaea subsp. europaea TaxID=158383 RepID=A0A8S0VML7_OLEEU|nr:Hypothetical predicted protein [Olea europaea subsp. europaea]